VRGKTWLPPWLHSSHGALLVLLFIVWGGIENPRPNDGKGNAFR